VARWSLDFPENRVVPVFGRDWIIGDRRLPGSVLVLENDLDYTAIRAAGAELLPVRERTWRRPFFYSHEAGNLASRPVLVPIMAEILAPALWWLLLS
jgi:hypothetical protein